MLAERRVQLGFALQPVLAAVLTFFAFPVINRAAGGGRTVDVDATQAAIGLGVVTGIVALVITVCAASPLFRYVRKRRPPTGVQTLFLGAALGNIPAAIAMLGSLVSRAAQPDLSLGEGVAGFERAIVLGTFLGAIGAAVFWLVAGRHVASTRTTNAV